MSRDLTIGFWTMRHGYPYTEAMRKARNIAVCLLILVAAALWGKWAARDKAARDLEACKQNVRNLGTSLEMYSSDHAGGYPGTGMDHPPTERSLRAVVPGYLKTFPTCPAAGEDTYSRTYTTETCPASYLFWCSGNHHGDLHPGYDSIQGSIETLESLRTSYGYFYRSEPPDSLPPGEPPCIHERPR